MRRWFWSPPLALAILLLTGLPVFAIGAPDSEAINESYAYRNLLETGDRLIVFRYTINYAVTPNETVRQAYIFRMLDTNGTTELKQALAYPYFQHGYGTGISAFYFSAADNLTWNNAYFIRISGNPVYLPNLADKSFAVSASAWYAGTTQTENQAALAGRIVDIVGNLESPWNMTLLTTNSAGQTILNTTAKTYILAAIPGIMTMAPSAFDVQLFSGSYSPAQWGTAQADAYKNRFVGTWVQDGANALSGITTLNFQLSLSIVFVVAAVLLMVAYRMKFNEGTPAILDILALRYLWVLLGWISLGISAVITLLLTAMLGYVILFDRS